MSQRTSFPYIVCQWFLHVYVLTQLHCCQSLNSVIVIWCRYRDAIYVFMLFIKHFSKVGIELRFRKLFYRAFSACFINITQESNIRSEEHTSELQSRENLVC